MIRKVDRILLIETNSYDVAIPTDALVLIHSIKLSNCFVWIVNECVVATVTSIVCPGQVSNRTHLMAMSSLRQYEHVYRHSACQCQNNVKKVTSGEDNAKFACLEGEEFVFERRKTEIRIVFDLIETLGTPVYSLFS